MVKSKTKTKARKRRAATAAYAPPPPHLERPGEAIIATAGDSNDDEMLTEAQMAAWFGCSQQWLKLGRTRGYGPPYELLSPRMVRYQRGKARQWLNGRTHNSTAEYAKV